jgi:Response regulators consisting of a CheY-like receiver domain and a winged-helix DNA-binding domain
VIMLTAKNTEYDKVQGLDTGADDYIGKPFGMMELVARVRAVLRRAEHTETVKEYTVGALYVSPRRHEVKVNGEEVTLTFKEFSLLCLLLENWGIVMTREVLMNKVWGLGAERENRTLDVHIRTLRSKLGEAGSYIETVRGVGYRITGEDK